MRFLRGLLAAAVVAGAAGLCIWAGHIGSNGGWRIAATLTLGAVAWLVASWVAPSVATGYGEEVGWLVALPAMVLVGALIWLTAIDVEVKSGQWQAVVVMDKDCESSDDGCAWRYRVSDLRTERDLGWIYCDDDGLETGEHTRVHADPSGHHRASLEPCAYTSHGWTVGLRVVQGLWVLSMLAALAVGTFCYDPF
jgi:hypothetical protein